MKRRKEHGVVSIEVAIGIFPLLLMFFAWVEISYLGYVSSLVDYAISEGARQSKAVAAKMDSGKVNYETIFKNVVRESNSVWAKFVDVENITLKNYHYQNIKDLNAECFKPEDCNLNPGSQAYQSPIAVYQLSYEYSPMFGVFYPEKSVALKREIIVIQEYERDEFVN